MATAASISTKITRAEAEFFVEVFTSCLDPYRDMLDALKVCATLAQYVVRALRRDAVMVMFRLPHPIW